MWDWAIRPNGEDWGVYGGYTYFHRNVPMYWPKDEAALTAAADAFDILLYTKPPPSALGFDPVRCIGEVCVAQRPAKCRPIPMTALPVPGALRETSGPRSAMLSERQGSGNWVRGEAGARSR